MRINENIQILSYKRYDNLVDILDAHNVPDDDVRNISSNMHNLVYVLFFRGDNYHFTTYSNKYNFIVDMSHEVYTHNLYRDKIFTFLNSAVKNSISDKNIDILIG